MLNFFRLLRTVWPAMALLAIASVALPGCGTLAGALGGAQQAAADAEQDSKPRKRIAALSAQLKATRDGLGEAYNAKLINAAELAAVEAPNAEATALLKAALSLMEDAQRDRQLADSAPDGASKAIYQAQAAAAEKYAMDKARSAEALINPLRARLDRARGVPPVALPIVPKLSLWAPALEAVPPRLVLQARLL